MSSLYEITGDLLALQDLLDGMTDENGEPREPTEEEIETMKNWFELSEAAFSAKFDNYCKLLRNLKNSAENADSERQNFKAELDRLSRRSRAYLNRAECLKGMLWESMQRLHMQAFKSDLFSAKEQNTQIAIKALDGDDLSKIPECYLKPRELNVTAIKAAIKSGELVCGKEAPNAIETELNKAKIFDKKTGKEIRGLRWEQGKALYIR